MQDRYAGDIGDYGKIALLKELTKQGLFVGVNWYKTATLNNEKKDDGSFKNRDGKYSIPEKYRLCDPNLATKLLDIYHGGNRTIETLEEADLIPGAIYYSDIITAVNRTEWHKEALKKLKPVDIVFLDPDNGLLVKSVGKRSMRSVKYAFYDEVRDYINQEQSVLIYNHRCRKPEEIYFRELCEKLQIHTGIIAHDIMKITFPKCSIRDYLAVPASKDHLIKIRKAFANMEQGKWGELGLCRIPYYDD